MRKLDYDEAYNAHIYEANEAESAKMVSDHLDVMIKRLQKLRETDPLVSFVLLTSHKKSGNGSCMAGSPDDVARLTASGGAVVLHRCGV